MKKLFWILLFGALASSSFNTSVQAQSASGEEGDSVNLQELDCRTLLKSEDGNRSNILIFMHGFMSGQNNETVVDAPALTQVSDQVLDACIDSPDRTLMSVFEEYR